MCLAKIDVTEYLVLADLSREWKLYFPVYLERRGRKASAFIWDGNSDRRTVYPSTIKALIRKGLLIEMDRHGSPLKEYRISVDGRARAANYKAKSPEKAAIGELAFSK